MEFFDRLPPRITEEIYSTVHPASLWGKETFAKRLMSSCNQCYACKEACPEQIDLGELMLEGRRLLAEKGKIAWVFHDFWLRDMKHANETGRLLRLPPGMQECGVVFFPGCQLGGSDPRYVVESYRWLLSKRADTALWLRCCGVPAIWSGDEELSEKALQELRDDWAQLGRPEIVFACPTCKKTFETYLPEMKGTSLFEQMAEAGFQPRRRLDGACLSVFDPCRSRDETKLQDAVRDLANQSGASLEPLQYERENARCCSWGGHVAIANPAYTQYQIAKRTAQNALPYVTYCSNCRDILSEAGKPCVHVLDLLFDLGEPGRPQPGWSARRENREKLKQQALLEFWREETALPSNSKEILLIDNALKKKLSDHYLLEEEAAMAVLRCERSGRFITNPETGNRTGFAVIGRNTVWVTYRKEGEKYRLLNAYGHRMNIKLEQTWNGKLADTSP